MIFFLLPILCFSATNFCDQKSEFLPMKQTYPFTLMIFPYDFTYLEPFLTSTIIYAHYEHHHRGYVSKLNSYIQTNSNLEGKSLEQLVDLALNDTTLQKYAGGVYNHNLY